MRNPGPTCSSGFVFTARSLDATSLKHTSLPGPAYSATGPYESISSVAALTCPPPSFRNPRTISASSRISTSFHCPCCTPCAGREIGFAMPPGIGGRAGKPPGAARAKLPAPAAQTESVPRGRSLVRSSSFPEPSRRRLYASNPASVIATNTPCMPSPLLCARNKTPALHAPVHRN